MFLIAFETWTDGVDRKLLDSFLLDEWTEKFCIVFSTGVDGNLIHRYEQSNAFNGL